MTEKIGIIKNPLTIIAIFAGIAEVSGTIVLPFVSSENQLPFIYFLITFPCALVILFFLTLNFNNKALYAPSDFSNEENYIKIFKYDVSKQEKIEVKIKQEDLIKLVNENINELKYKTEEKIATMESELKFLKVNKEKNTNEKYLLEENYEVQEEEESLISISNFPNANVLRKKLIKMGYDAEIYIFPSDAKNKATLNYSDNKAIWLGKRVALDIAQTVIKLAKTIYPHLEYIDLSDHDWGAPEYVHESIYIGGATSSAIEKGLKKMTIADFERLFNANSVTDFHSIIKEFK